MKHIKLFTDLRLYIVLICTCTLLASCTKKYADINTDRNTIATIGSAELPFLFARAEEEATPSIWNYQVAGLKKNFNVGNNSFLILIYH